MTYRCARSRARMHINTLGVVTEACINNVAERNRMQILPYIRVYRELAGSEQLFYSLVCPQAGGTQAFLS